ncbi:hypothetical protein BH23ACT12_BH23ACT12_19560 [soil metagenome]
MGWRAMGRLTQATLSGASYNGWDKNFNRTSDEVGLHSYNDGDQLIDPGFVHDADGNQTASTAYPSATYNGIDQTLSITKAGQAALAFGYAGMGQSERISAGATTTKNGVLGKQIETTGGQSTAYVHDAYGGLVYQDGPGGDDYYYYYFDGLGSVIGMTDTAGNQRAKYSYDPFGAHATETAVNGSLPANPWRWMGGLGSTGLYHFGERYYDPELGRFLQVDPVAGGSCNAYDYACGDPINSYDLTGTKARGLCHLAASSGDTLS